MAFIKNAIASVALLALAACAQGNRVDYTGTTKAVPVNSTNTVGILVLDERSYVRSGNKPGQFVGLQRSVMGIPYDVRTASGRPLADEFADAIAGLLAENNAKGTPLPWPARASHDQAVAMLVAVDADRFVLMTITEWKSESLARMRLTYNLKVEVFDKAKNLLAENSISEVDALGRQSALRGYGADLIPQQRRIFQTLFGNPEMRRALRFDVKAPS